MCKLILISALLCTASLAQQTGVFTDARDNKTYKTAKIGEQIWMAENLNYEAEGSVCYYNKLVNCKKYGRLYNWHIAMKVCPKGWHLPSNDEWEVLTAFIGGKETAGKYLKAKSGWNSNNGKSGNGLDKYGFSGLPSGYCYSDGSFSNVGNSGIWWSASEYTSNDADYRLMSCYHDRTNWVDGDKSFLLSVRCLQD